ncbi:2-oxoglutarate-dependent ethylene/succinate-forming enzyme [Caballeronia hypogeia]|uniref:2-oxoglutarate-dependent ethylene/succinate-forming enzyme n=1 Tax=Caballeronia hypogeia TaxID=1777140 RepID=A0A158AGI1_9BURK|nr:2-oxoglutarate and iron-dependent oxygenase domain-containing protein [Caballeronia hypogeia]SAK56825.1 2-oxoglutarate-dependent ethylene/succinate-forming enzyme [Caballeronia hypogeia]
MPATRIPVIDFAGVLEGDAAALARAGREIHEACTTIGFFYIVNHGVPQAVIDAASQAARTFFAHPVETKRRAAVNQRHRGFNSLGDATMYQAKKPDYKEFFSIGLELPEDDPDVLAGQALRGPNNWPDFMPELRPVLYRYYEAIGACGSHLLRAVAASLGIDEQFFAARYGKRMQRTQMVYYPPQPPQSDEDQFGVAPHTDYGCITLLWQDNVGGLQVREIASGTWIDAPPIPGSFVVNVGDLLARWTNDRFRSTLHRVINASGRERYSIATFYDPTYDAIVDPVDLGTPAGESRHAPVAAGDYILGRINDSMGYRKKRAAEQGSAA